MGSLNIKSAKLYPCGAGVRVKQTRSAPSSKPSLPENKERVEQELRDCLSHIRYICRRGIQYDTQELPLASR